MSTLADRESGLPFGLTDIDSGLVSWMQEALLRVEMSLGKAVWSHEDLLAQSAGHLADAGGKRFRPLLALLGAQYGARGDQANIDGAVVAELTHLATLYHDDVMDEATVRRGTESANLKWGNTVAILTGDYLFARAADIAASLGPEIVRLQARTFQRLVEGQIRETLGPRVGQDSVDHHLEVLGDKTGSLIAASARMGALTSGADREVADVLSAFGEQIGVAFQLSDDLLDISTVQSDSGKTQGTDLREGIRTLPILCALKDLSPDSTRLRELLQGPLPDEQDHFEALVLLQAHSAMDQARAVLQQWADAARTTLEPLRQVSAPDTAAAATHALDVLCDAVVHRHN